MIIPCFDKYVIIDFEAFPSIIEALGGIEVTLSEGEADEINRKSGEDPSLYVTAGTHKLTSKQARYYARIRMQDYTDPENIRPLFFRGSLQNGVLNVPDRNSGEVRG